MLVEIKKGDVVKTIVTENGGYLQTAKSTTGLPLPASGYSKLAASIDTIPFNFLYLCE